MPGNRLATLVKYKGNNEFIYYSSDFSNNNSDNLHTIDPVPLAHIGPNNAEQSIFYKIKLWKRKIQNYGTQLGGKKLKKTRKSKKPKKPKTSLKFKKSGK